MQKYIIADHPKRGLTMMSIIWLTDHYGKHIDQYIKKNN